jgi:hypothetical protein
MKKIILFLLFLQKSFNIEFNEEEKNVLNKIHNELYKKDINLHEILKSKKKLTDIENNIYNKYCLEGNKNFIKDNVLLIDQIKQEIDNIETTNFIIKFFKKEELTEKSIQLNQMLFYHDLYSKLKDYREKTYKNK